MGPFIPLLRSPEFMSRLQKTGAYLRYETKLGSNISEIIILLTARHWTQQFEWDAHESIAKQAGVNRRSSRGLPRDAGPAGMSADEEVIHDFCHGIAPSPERQRCHWLMRGRSIASAKRE